MVKTWAVIYPKKQNIEETLKKWLKEKYEVELTISDKSQNLFEEFYNRPKNVNGNKFEALMVELNKE
jgi:phage-related minor tail protein